MPKTDNLSSETTNKPPVLARRGMHKKSTIVSGRTIGEAREHLETANERALARKKDKRKRTIRIAMVSGLFLALVIVLALLARSFINQEREEVSQESEVIISRDYTPTVEILDQGGQGITNRMKEYIGMVEADFRDLGYKVVKAILPTGSIREVDFYIEGRPGYIKMIIDRDAAVSVEDADRVMRYLASQGITEYNYIDVRIDGKAYWK